MTLSASHAIVTEIENRLRAAFPGAEVLIHQDPAGIQEDHHPDFAYEDTSALLEADAASQPRRL